MRLEDFDYNLPQELIAQTPACIRDKSRLMVLERTSGKIEHKIFKDIIFYLNENNVLVINDTKVIPARLFGFKESGNAKIELLLLRRAGTSQIWEVLVKSARRVKIGTKIILAKDVIGEILEKSPEGKNIVKFSYKGSFRKILEEIGEIPLPPYIKRCANEEDKKRYQTVFAQKEEAVAAPTAGLHFTPQLLKSVKAKGIKIIPITLYVGWGTFAPVREEDITKHKMETEFYEISDESADKINQAISEGKNIVSVGTTVVRALESAAEKRAEGWKLKAESRGTDIFIYPGYKFKIVKKLITNFHLPRSTLLMLVSAFAGTELIRKAYQEAINQKYRFFSYGDAMLIK